MNITAKALQALTAIHNGQRGTVSTQMIDRLSRDHLIDFDLTVNPKQGWYVTDAGREAMA